MGFWIFMVVTDMLIPAVMIGFGYKFLRKPPKNINPVFGYRTPMSMKNMDTWKFAHKYIGRLWYLIGCAMVPLTFLALFTVIGKDTDTVGTVGAVVCLVQMIPLLGCIVPTEKALKKNFDSEGKCREK